MDRNPLEVSTISYEEYLQKNKYKKDISEKQLRIEFLRKKFDNFSDPYNKILHSN